MNAASLAIYLWIALGGALGSVGRYAMAALVADRVGGVFPWGTLVVNVSGSFLIGLLAAFTEPGRRRDIGPTGQAFFMYGICGGYTTFSSFSLRTFEFVREGDWLKAGANVIASVVLCLIAVWLGYLFGLSLNGGKRT